MAFEDYLITRIKWSILMQHYPYIIYVSLITQLILPWSGIFSRSSSDGFTTPSMDTSIFQKMVMEILRNIQPLTFPTFQACNLETAIMNYVFITLFFYTFKVLHQKRVMGMPDFAKKVFKLI